MTISQRISNRILILDGAMGTMIQSYHLEEEDFRKGLPQFVGGPLKGCNDVLCLSRPDVVTEIHRKYLEAGADIIETNSFNATSVSLEEYHLSSYVHAINLASARLARSVADEFSKLTPEKPRFVAGSVGPTGKMCSMSPDISNPAFRAITYDELTEAYVEQMTALLEGRVDVLLIETVFDTLNAKAALEAANHAMVKAQRKVPLMLSITLTNQGGKILSGQTLDALLASVQHVELFSIGLNCSFGAAMLKPFLRQLAVQAPYYISVYPNAGLPDSLGRYVQTPEQMATELKSFVDEGLVNIIGGCCGTTDAYIAAISSFVEGARPHNPITSSQYLQLSGLELLEVRPENNFINIGERCSAARSCNFCRLIREKKYEKALSVAREQVNDGALVLDINMDDELLDARTEMVHFLNLLSADPEVARVPIMIDSSKWEVIESGLKCLQGKSIVNSISLKEGESVFLEHARRIRELGAAVVVMAFDEQGQADTCQRKIDVCSRAYELLVKQVGFAPSDIIFDPNVLAVATEVEEHANYAADFISAARWIHTNLPGAHVSGRVSNLSLAFRENDYIREAMHAVFLFHAIQAGMDMGIVNSLSPVLYAEIPKDLLQVIEDVVLNCCTGAVERLVDLAGRIRL